jgi:hypothetical protein
MGHYTIAALVVVILMTVLIEFYLFKFELFASKNID